MESTRRRTVIRWRRLKDVNAYIRHSGHIHKMPWCLCWISRVGMRVGVVRAFLVLGDWEERIVFLK